MVARLLIGLIKIYRYVLAPWVGGACRFSPTCSCYAIDALQQHGAWRGLALTIGRILRCQPWCAGGYDPVPNRKSFSSQP